MFVEDNIITMIEDTIKDLDKIEDKWYNMYGIDFYLLALFLYGRYGELPAELMDEKILKNICDYIKKQESIYNDNINEFVEEYIFQNS